MKECADCGSTSWNVLGFACQHELCSMALQADGEKLRQLTGDDHGPWSSICEPCGEIGEIDPKALFGEFGQCPKCDEPMSARKIKDGDNQSHD